MCIDITCILFCCFFVFFFKQKTAYEMRISDWSSDVCSSDLTLVSGPQSRKNFDDVHDLNALGRGVDVTEIVAALRFIVATPTLTGQTITLDGGQRFLALPRDVQFVETRCHPMSPVSPASCPIQIGRPAVGKEVVRRLRSWVSPEP